MKKFINLIFVVVFICVCHFSNAQFSFTDLGPPGGGSGGGAGGAAGAAGECEGNEFCQEVNAANAACDGLSGFIGNVNNVGSYFNVPIDIPTGRGGTDFCTMTSIGNGVVRAMCDPAWCGSMDPNEKVGLGNNSDNVHTAYFSLPYSIHFENLASAAAPAARVWVTDTLDAGKLDFSTFRFGQVQIGTDIMEQFAGNPLENFAIVNLRQSRGIDLKIETKFDPTTGIIKWYFASLDPTTYDVVEDPARGFLPPNTNGVEGAGSVTFFVDRKKLASGTEIRNRATITFDYNEPIRTTEWLVVVDTTRPESNVASLPPRSPSSFDLMWSGNDAHSGVSYYNIYVSENDGPYVLALRKTFGTTAVFNGTHGKKYEFLSLATDRAGNRELLPLNFLDEPDAVTVIDACINNSPEVILAHEVNCLYGGHASVDIDIRKGTQPFSFAWSSLETTQNISVSTAGFFEVTVTDVNNCTGSVNCNIANPSSWYEDFDTDGFGNVTNVVQDCAQPDGYVADNTDCNDDDITVHEPQQYFVDADHDGYGSTTTEMVCSSIAAVGYSTNNTDCNDDDITVHEPQQYFVDADHDGYGSTTTEMVCSSIAAVGYSTNNTDCNDADITVHEPQQYFVDADHDGYGSTTTEMVCSSVAAVGYSTNNTDCNDGDITVHEPQQYFVDADHDGYGSTTTEMVCSSIAAVGYSTNNTDCNDADITVHEPQQYFVDADHDGYGSTTTEMVCSSVAAVGYSTNNTDCNDGDITVHEPQQYFVDADHDGYGSTTTEMVCSSIAAVGYSTNNTDCNDDDITVHEPQQYFVDADHDGYGSTTTEMVCSSIVTEGYSTNNTDCNDVDVTVHEPQQYYVDGDRDGYGSTVKAFLCSSVAPIGYSTNNLDCNDNGVAGGAGVHPGAIEICNTRDDNCNGVIDEGVTTTFYRDADGDGFGNTAITIQACTSPPGYINNNADCNDVNASIKPNAVEICNGLDDNCNGATDEGVTTTFYRDADGDGFGNTAITIQACTAPPGYVNNNADCNDVDASIKPSAVEICNGSDDNCNGATDEGVTTTFYFDADGDGFGNAAITIQACSASPGYVSNNTDCNDASASVRPGGTEVCGNSTDDNCNGTVNEGCGTGCTMTVNAGIDEQTYYGYNADQSVTHTAIVNGGTAPFSYTWSLSRKLICNQVNTAGDELFTNGTCSANICPASDTSTTAAPTCFGSASISVTLMKDADICVRITDAAGCVANDCFHIISEDARCFAGNSGNSKVNVCHGTGSASNPWVQLCIAQTAVAAHLANNPGDYPGKCVKNSAKAEVETSETISETVRAYPNPFNDKLNIEFTLRKDSKVNLEIFNMAGQKLAEVFSGDLKANEKQKFEYLPAASCGCLVIYRLQTEYGAYYGRAMMLSAGSD